MPIEPVRLLARHPRVKRVLKAARVDRAYSYLRDEIFFGRGAVVVEKDLASLSPMNGALRQTDLEIVAVTLDAVTAQAQAAPRLSYPSAERHQKILRYLQRGYGGVALVRSGVVIGDIWYWSPEAARGTSVHPDLQWLPISCGKGDVYCFDLVLSPDQRGKNLANLLQAAALHHVRAAGFARALGYYWVDNLPAAWVHRTLRWREVRRAAVTRFFRLHRVT